MKKRFPVLIPAVLALLTSVLACNTLAPPTSPPLPANPKATATPTPVPTPTQTGTSCSNPASPGTTVVVDDMAMMINAVVRPADGVVATGSMSNPTPEPGNEFIIISLSVTCRKNDDESCVLSPFPPFPNFALLDSAGISSAPETEVAGVPGLLVASEFLGGSTIYGAMVFEVEQGETDLVLMYEDPSGTSEACLVVPSWTTALAAAPTPEQTQTPTPTSTPEATPTPEQTTTSASTPEVTPTPEQTTTSAPTPEVTPTPELTPTPTPTPVVLLPESGRAAGWPFALWAVGGVLVLFGWLWHRLKGRQKSTNTP